MLGFLGCHGTTQWVLNIRRSFLWYETETAPCSGDTFDAVDTSCSLWFATESHVSQLIFMRFEMVTTIKCKACFKDYQDSSVAQKTILQDKRQILCNSMIHTVDFCIISEDFSFGVPMFLFFRTLLVKQPDAQKVVPFRQSQGLMFIISHWTVLKPPKPNR